MIKSVKEGVEIAGEAAKYFICLPPNNPMNMTLDVNRRTVLFKESRIVKGVLEITSRKLRIAEPLERGILSKQMVLMNSEMVNHLDSLQLGVVTTTDRYKVIVKDNFIRLSVYLKVTNASD